VNKPVRVTASVAVLLAVLLTMALQSVQAGDAAAGAELFANFCQGCHGADKSGIGQYAGALEDLQLILEGETTNQMPDFYGVFSEDEVNALYSYLTVSVK
jgi:mono/diheme cytochrome c family protein